MCCPHNLGRFTFDSAAFCIWAAAGIAFGVPVSGQLQKPPVPVLRPLLRPGRRIIIPVGAGAGLSGTRFREGRDTVTVVYIDSVFVLNALMDYLLLLSAGRLAGVPLRRGR